MLFYLLAFVALVSGSIYFYRKHQVATRIKNAEVITQTLGLLFQKDAYEKAYREGTNTKSRTQ